MILCFETVANGGVKISGKSAHFTNQVIGSIYTGKSGVEIENIQKALKTKPQVLDEILYYTLDDICEVWVDSSTGMVTNVYSLVDRGWENGDITKTEKNIENFNKKLWYDRRRW